MSDATISKLLDFWHIEVVEPFLAYFNAAPKVPYKAKKAIQAEIDGFFDDVAKISARNAAKAHITGDLKAQKLLGIEFSDAMVQQEAVAFSKQYGKMLVEDGATIIRGKKVPWLREANKDTRKGVFEILQNGLKEGKPVTDISGRYADPGTIAYDLKEYLKGQDSRLARIARTEIASIQNHGTLTRFEDAGVTKVQVIDGDGCQACIEANGQIWTLDYANTHELEHPNCVRAFIPVVSSIKS